MNFSESIMYVFKDFLENDRFILSKLENFANNRIDIKERKDYVKEFYGKYNFKNEDPTVNLTEEDSKKLLIFKTVPNNYVFNIENFWFLEEPPSIEIKNGTKIGYRDGIKDIFYPGEYILSGEVRDEDFDKKSIINPPKFIHVVFPNKERKSTNSFFHMTFGKALTSMRHLPGIRIYINLNVKKPIEKIRDFLNDEIIGFLNDRLIPFQLKTITSVADFNRRDNCVLYIAQAHFWLIKEQLIKIKEKYSDNLFHDRLPLFVFPLFKGVGLAEDPIIGSSFSDGVESFGESRINILLETLFDAIDTDISQTYTISDLEEDLVSKGFNTSELFRNPYTNFDYSIRKERRTVPFHNSLVSSFSEKRLYYKLNEEAVKIGLNILQKAHFKNSGLSAEINWVTIRKNGTYSYLGEKEKNVILLFLDCISRIKVNRKLLTNELLEIISQAGDNKKQKYLDYLKNEYWEYWIDNIDKIKFFEAENLKEYFSLSKTGKGKIWESIMAFFSKPVKTDLEDLYRISPTDFKTKELRDKVWNVYESYSKIQYPLKNAHGNYYYDPISLTHIGLMFIFIYCPAVFPDLD